MDFKENAIKSVPSKDHSNDSHTGGLEAKIPCFEAFHFRSVHWQQARIDFLY